MAGSTAGPKLKVSRMTPLFRKVKNSYPPKEERDGFDIRLQDCFFDLFASADSSGGSEVVDLAAYSKFTDFTAGFSPKGKVDLLLGSQFSHRRLPNSCLVARCQFFGFPHEADE